jgi:hypothetical protein
VFWGGTSLGKGPCGVSLGWAGDVPASPAVLMAPIASKSCYEELEGRRALAGRGIEIGVTGTQRERQRQLCRLQFSLGGRNGPGGSRARNCLDAPRKHRGAWSTTQAAALCQARAGEDPPLGLLAAPAMPPPGNRLAGGPWVLLVVYYVGASSEPCGRTVAGRPARWPALRLAFAEAPALLRNAARCWCL